MTTRATIAEQVEAAAMASAAFEASLKHTVTKGDMDATEGRRLVVAMRSAVATLEAIEEHAEGLRALMAHLIRSADAQWASEAPSKRRQEAEALSRHPAVAALVEAFPEAIVESIRPVAPPRPPEAVEETPDDDSTHAPDAQWASEGAN